MELSGARKILQNVRGLLSGAAYGVRLYALAFIAATPLDPQTHTNNCLVASTRRSHPTKGASNALKRHHITRLAFRELKQP